MVQKSGAAGGYGFRRLRIVAPPPEYTISGGYRSGAAAGSVKGPTLRPTVASLGRAQTPEGALRCLKAVLGGLQTPEGALWCLKAVLGGLQTRKRGLWCLKPGILRPQTPGRLFSCLDPAFRGPHCCRCGEAAVDEGRSSRKTGINWDEPLITSRSSRKTGINWDEPPNYASSFLKMG
jgi:hypothetical protein